MDSLVLKSPAKINLFLKVLGKRPDGYHRIETVFQKIDLCDRIVLRKSKSGITVASNRTDLPNDKRNLAYKAAQLLLEKTERQFGVSIEIQKNIPISAGLGGGSSNAATVLLGLNRLYNLKMSPKDLLGLAKKIGADVAFFVWNCSFAQGTSRGDVITPIKTGLKLWHVLIVPPFGLSTRDIYESLESYRKDKDTDIDEMVSSLRSKNLTRLSNLLYNRLEEVVIDRHAEINRLKAALLDTGARGALMSGSGPVIFGITKTRKEAMYVEKGLRQGILACKKEWQVYIVHTL